MIEFENRLSLWATIEGCGENVFFGFDQYTAVSISALYAVKQF